MGRTVSIRAVYTRDAIYLTRLMQGVEKDPLRPLWWKKRVLSHLQAVVTDFMVPAEQLPSDEPEPK